MSFEVPDNLVLSIPIDESPQLRQRLAPFFQKYILLLVLNIVRVLLQEPQQSLRKL